MVCLIKPFNLSFIKENRLYVSQSLPRAFEFSSKVRDTRIHASKLPTNLRYPRRTKLAPDPGIDVITKKRHLGDDDDDDITHHSNVGYGNNDNLEGEGVNWEKEEIEAISSLFQQRIPQKPGKLDRERPLPLPLPYKLRPLGLPTPKRHHTRLVYSSKDVCKNPEFLVGLAREIKKLPSGKNVSVVLNNCAPFLRKGSLSLTIKELGYMGLPDQALQTFCWAQKQPHLFPDDRILASVVEVLGKTHDLKLPFDLKRFTSIASRGIIEAMIRGFIKGGNLNLALKLLFIAKNGDRILDSSVYAHLIRELGKNPDKRMLVVPLLDELGERDGLYLSQQDCISLMKVNAGLGNFETVESLFDWYKNLGHSPSIVMYTTMIHSRYCEKKYREAMALVWHMEAANILLDLPAYRVVIKLCVALDDLSRTTKYFSRLKDAGFFPTYDIYRDLIKIHLASGRLAKCREIRKDIEIAGFTLDKQMIAQMLQVESKISNLEKGSKYISSNGVLKVVQTQAYMGELLQV